MNFFKRKIKEHVPEDPESDPSSSDSSLSESYLSDNRKYRKSRSKSEYDPADDIKYIKFKSKGRDK